MIKCFFIPGLGKKPAFFYKIFRFNLNKFYVNEITNEFFNQICFYSNVRQFRGINYFIYQDFVPDDAIDVDVPFKTIKVFKLC